MRRGNILKMERVIGSTREQHTGEVKNGGPHEVVYLDTDGDPHPHDLARRAKIVEEFLDGTVCVNEILSDVPFVDQCE